jgi:nucleotide-binding universal stress UspA family protein
MKPIVIATDLTSTSENATRLGVTLARDLGVDVILAHAWEPTALVFFDAALAVTPETLATKLRQAQQRLDEIAARYTIEHQKISTRLVEGTPAEAIDALAREVDARLVVVGTQLPRLVTRLLGSVSTSMLHTLQHPVLVVHAQNH